MTGRKRSELLVFTAVLAVALYLLVLAFQYRPDARLVPILVLVVVTVLTAAKIFLDLLDVLGVELPLRLHVGSDSYDPLSEIDEMTDGETLTRSRQVRSIGWLFCFTVAMYLFGFYYTIPVVLAAFLLTETDAPLTKILAVVVGVWIFIYVMFELVLSMPDYSGALWAFSPVVVLVR